MCRQRGFGLPLAVFIITVLALIGAAMVALTRTGQESVASEIQSIRAFYAAESGAQLALVAVLCVEPQPGLQRHRPRRLYRQREL